MHTNRTATKLRSFEHEHTHAWQQPGRTNEDTADGDSARVQRTQALRRRPGSTATAATRTTPTCNCGAEAYANVQRTDECTEIRQRLFEATGSVEDYRVWCKRLPAESRGAAEAEARRWAEDHPDPVTAAPLLLEVGDEAAAESVLAARYDGLKGRDYSRVQWLAETMEARHRAVGATACCYRALLLDILSRAFVRAYAHAARYRGKVRHLALETPEDQL